MLHILNGHKILWIRRKSGYKRNLIAFLSLIFSLLFLLSLLFTSVSGSDFESIAPFVFPALLILDFSLRFFLKKNASAAIFPYLCLPIQRKILILYMILSDMQQIWVWGCGLIYGVILYLCGNLTFLNAITLLFMLLFNNYLIIFLKTLAKGYSILLYPVCLVLVSLILFIINVLNPFWSMFVSFAVACAIILMLYHALKEDLYDELNRIAL